MKEVRQQSSDEVEAAAPEQAAVGKLSRVEAAGPGGGQVDGNLGEVGAGGQGGHGGQGQRAGDWAMTPGLAGAMGLDGEGGGGVGGGVGRDPSTPSGRHEKTDFGEYWVVPDGNTECIFDSRGEIIGETEFTTAKAVWEKVKDGSGKVKILETDLSGKATAGFKATMLTKVSMLMSRPKGRELLMGLSAGAYDVTIRPSTGKINGGAQARRGGDGSLEKADGKAGAGSSTTVEIDPSCSDTDNKVHDKDGKEISDPIYIFLGHELIHAKHNQEGRNRRNLAAKSNKYSNREEEETIATGAGINENSLRAEHGLTARIGHSGRDTRF